MRERLKDNLFRTWIVLSTSLVFIIVVYMFLYIFINGAGTISREFLFSDPKGMPMGSEGGIFPAIVGSLLLMLIACVFASILAISTAIYLVFYCSSERVKRLIHLIIQ